MLDILQNILDFIGNIKITEFFQSILERFGSSSSAIPEATETPTTPVETKPESVPLTPLEPATPTAPRVDDFGNEEIPGAAATG